MSIVCCWWVYSRTHMYSDTTHTHTHTNICVNLSVDMTMRLQNACVELHFNMPRATLCGLCANGVLLSHSLCLTPNSVLFDPMCTKLPLGCLAAQGKLSHFMPAAASSVVQLFRGPVEKSFGHHKIVQKNCMFRTNKM